jgi:Flp pilus assembly protein TadD
MAISVSLRKSLRAIPGLRSLPSQDLDAIAARMVCKEYKDGAVLWRSNSQLDFLGIIERGEILVEHRKRGVLISSTKMNAGDYVQLHDLKENSSSILARAITDIRFYAFTTKQSKPLRSKHGILRRVLLSKLHQIQYVSLAKYWMVVVAFLVILFMWSDLIRVLSGILFVASNQIVPSASNYQESLSLLKQAEKIDPDAAFAHNQEGYIWYQKNNLQDAELAFIRASSIDQNHGLTLNNLSVTYYATGQLQKSKSLLQNAVKKNPDSAIVRYNFGVVLLNLNHEAEALREFKEASYIEASWAAPYIQQGFIHIHMQDYVNAEREARTAIKLDPTQESAHLIMAIALYNQGKNQDALRFVDSALKISPNDNVAIFYKGLILSNLGEFDSALSILQDLLKSSNNDQEISRITVEINALYRYMDNASLRTR